LCRHAARVDAQHNRPAVPLADCDDSVQVRGQVHVMSVAPRQALAQNGLAKARRGAVEQQVGWCHGRQVQVDLDAVALVGANAQAVFAERITLLVAGGDDFMQLGAGNRTASRRELAQQFVHGGPAGGVQREPDLLGLMAQDQAEELAERGQR